MTLAFVFDRMFDDLIVKKEYTEMACQNCYYGSGALSEKPGKVKCQLYNRHKDLDDICSNWRNAKHRLNLSKSN